LSKAVGIFRPLSEVHICDQDAAGSELLVKYGAVEFLTHFAEYLKSQKMNDVAAECQLIARNLVKFGAQSVAFEPIREHLKAQNQEPTLEAGNDRKKYRREQPLIDENIRQREVNDDQTTEATESLLKKDKNKMELLLNPVLNAEIFLGTV
jgi:hypothetical protein